MDAKRNVAWKEYDEAAKIYEKKSHAEGAEKKMEIDDINDITGIIINHSMEIHKKL